jgi:imidazolonepropionase-like amidohydrolase
MKALITLSILITFAFAQESVLYMNATAHIGNGKVIDNSAIGVNNGKIDLVANALLIRVDSSKYDTVIYLQGKHIYPGLIAPNSTLGLVEIDAVRATRDAVEVGKMKPHVRSVIAYNTDSDVVKTVRSNGVLVAQVTPRGGRITGTSSIIGLDGYNWEDAALKMDNGIHVNWPHQYKRSFWSTDGKLVENEKYDEQKQELIDFLSAAKAYAEIKKPEELDIRYEACKGLFDGSKKLFIDVDYIKEIQDVIAFKKEFEFDALTLVGGYDSWMIADLLKINNISVMLTRTHSLPQRPEDDVDLPYKLPFLLKKAGVKFCLQNAGDMEAMNSRNLPFLAGTAVSYGLTKEEALSAVTLSAAEILGVANKIGSLEEGKLATLFVSEGDALDMVGNQVSIAMINGVFVDLSNHQKELYEKYMKRYSLPIED